MNEQYPNDKESQEWMNAPLGKPVSTPEEQVRFWSDKYDAKVDELHEMWKRARSFEVDFNAATEAIKKLESELNAEKQMSDQHCKDACDFKVKINLLKAEIEEIQGQYERNIDFWQRKSSKSQKIGYKCPSCRNSTVTIDSSGFLVCALIGCKDPSRIHEIISREIIWENGMEL